MVNFKLFFETSKKTKLSFFILRKSSGQMPINKKIKNQKKQKNREKTNYFYLIYKTSQRQKVPY